MNTLPKARTENLVEQNLNRETLSYDLIANRAFNLKETLSIVYKACNGQTTFQEIKRRQKFGDDFIYPALDELKRNDLLTENADYVSPFAGRSRREIGKKVGLATMLVSPLIDDLLRFRSINAIADLPAGIFLRLEPFRSCLFCRDASWKVPG